MESDSESYKSKATPWWGQPQSHGLVYGFGVNRIGVCDMDAKREDEIGIRERLQLTQVKACGGLARARRNLRVSWSLCCEAKQAASGLCIC